MRLSTNLAQCLAHRKHAINVGYFNYDPKITKSLLKNSNSSTSLIQTSLQFINEFQYHKSE